MFKFTTIFQHIIMSLFELIESMLSKTHCSGQTFGFGITVPKHGKAQTAGRCSTSTQLRNARRARFIMVCLAECRVWSNGRTDDRRSRQALRSPRMVGRSSPSTSVHIKTPGGRISPWPKLDASGVHQCMA